MMVEEELKKTLGVDVIDLSSPKFFQNRTPVIKKMLEDMPTGEREEINTKVERYKIGGLPPDIQSQ